MRCNIHGSTQLLHESHMRPLFSLHDNDCRRTKLPAYALTRPLRNALHRNVLPELLSAGDSSSLLHSFLATLFFTAFFLLPILYAGVRIFVKQIPIPMVKRSAMLPPEQQLQHDKLPFLPSYHQTEADNFSPYGSR